jgi:hypothetical protein
MTKRGMLSSCFSKIANKRLSSVETNPKQSNQHEFNGSEPLKKMFGLENKKRIPTKFIWLNDHQEGVTEDGFISWYESRKPPRSEYRLYYDTNPVTELMTEGDSFFVGLRPTGEACVIVTPSGSEIGSQVAWLFGLSSEPGLKFETKDIEDSDEASLDFASRYILDELGIEYELPEIEKLDLLLKKFPDQLPTTAIFSKYVRDELLRYVSPIEEPDVTLMAWLDLEEKLFRRHEHFEIAARLDAGFKSSGVTDVEGFLKFSLSVQNKRKSRMGFSLEHHIEALLVAHNISYTRGAVTEHRNKPDFLFPGISEYKNASFPSSKLRMLASKSTSKDRWRQALSEAVRIENKHLITLEPGISQNQTDEMQAKKLRLVIPKAIHTSYKSAQRSWLMSVSDFLNELKFIA